MLSIVIENIILFIDELQLEMAFKVHKKTNDYGTPILSKEFCKKKKEFYLKLFIILISR